MRLERLLEDIAERDPHRAAVWQPGGSAGIWATYGELDARASALARRLRQLGLDAGDRVASLLDSSPAWVVAHFAVLKANAVNVPLSTDLGAAALAHILEHSGARALIIGRRYARLLDQLPAGGRRPELILWDPPATIDVTEGRVDPASPRSDRELAAIVYTSGSTGEPKGVMLSHRNLSSSTESTVEYLGLTERDRVLLVLPLHYIYGLSVLYTHLRAGASLLIDHRFAYPNVVLDTLAEHEATGFAGVPSTFTLLLHKSTLKKRRFPSLRYVSQAGGAMAPVIQQEVQRVFAPARLFVMYGCTEAAPRLSYVEPERLPEKWGSIGRAVPNVDLFVADETGRPVARGETGEIVARGPNIMVGYWKDAEGTAEVLRDGLYFTGDLAREDADGFLFIVGRKREILKVGGHRVSTKEIEEAVLAFPGVAEAAVVGVDDAVLGEAPVAFVVSAGGVTVGEAELRNFLKERLPSYGVPKSVRPRAALPKSAAGKINKLLLREEAAQQATAASPGREP